MRSFNAVAFATIFFFNSANIGLAQEECIKCRQNYLYRCIQNLGECIEACSSISTTDKNACRRRCVARDDGCNARVALKCGTCAPEHFSIPPPARMQAMTIGLPTVLRQFSMAWLSSRACAGTTAKRKQKTAAPPIRAAAVMKYPPGKKIPASGCD